MAYLTYKSNLIHIKVADFNSPQFYKLCCRIIYLFFKQGWRRATKTVFNTCSKYMLYEVLKKLYITQVSNQHWALIL